MPENVGVNGLRAEGGVVASDFIELLEDHEKRIEALEAAQAQATATNSAMATLLDRLDNVMATPQDEKVRKDEIRAIVYEWRQLCQ